MDTMRLQIITPKKIVKELDVEAVSVPTSTGEITILPRHMNLFSLLVEGVVKIKEKSKEDFLAIGGGYLQTNGDKVTVLVSRAYGQDEIDEDLIKKAMEQAKNILKTSKDEGEKSEAMAMMRRAIVSSKLLKKRKPKTI